MRIGEAATKAGVSPRAMRYYEERGLVTSQRSPAGQRHYSPEVVARVRLIQLLYAAGLTSASVAELLPCLHTGVPTQAQRALLGAERDRVERKLAQLGQTRDRLDAVITASDALTCAAHAPASLQPARPAALAS